MFDSEPTNTILLIFAALLYGAVASGCVLRTLFEGFAVRAPWDAWRVLGLILCFIWPILLLAPLAQLWRGSRKPGTEPRGLGSLRGGPDRAEDDRVRSKG
jgi:hypothetical protein